MVRDISSNAYMKHCQAHSFDGSAGVDPEKGDLGVCSPPPPPPTLFEKIMLHFWLDFTKLYPLP